MLKNIHTQIKKNLGEIFHKIIKKNMPHKHKKKHKLKVSHWENGKLHSREFEFDSLEEAKHHSKHHKGIRKIYDELEILVFVRNEDGIGETYC